MLSYCWNIAGNITDLESTDCGASRAVQVQRWAEGVAQPAPTDDQKGQVGVKCGRESRNQMCSSQWLLLEQGLRESSYASAHLNALKRTLNKNWLPVNFHPPF